MREHRRKPMVNQPGEVNASEDARDAQRIVEPDEE